MSKTSRSALIDLLEALDVHLRPALLDVLHNFHNDPSYIGLPQEGEELYNWLQQFKLHKGHASRRIIKDSQWDLLCPKTGISDSSTWDITIIILLINNCIHTPSDDLSKFVSSAREIRNELNHMTSSGLKKPIEYWDHLTRVLEGLKYRKMSSFNQMREEATNETDEIRRLYRAVIIVDDNVELGNNTGASSITLEFPEGYSEKFPETTRKKCDDFKEKYKQEPESIKNVNKKNLYYYYSEIVISTKGTSGKVYLGFSVPNRTWVAIKKCETNYNEEGHIEELETLKKIANVTNKSSLTIIDLLGYEITTENYYIITPIYEFTLEEYLEKKKPEFAERVEILGKLLEVISSLHEKHKIRHRDLKPNNIMFQMDTSSKSYELKLIDFGESRSGTGQTRKTRNVGDPLWLPPEITVGDNSAYTFIHESFVVCMLAVYILSNGYHPFVDEDDKSNVKQLQEIYRKYEYEFIRSVLPEDPNPNMKSCFDIIFEQYKFYFQITNKEFSNVKFVNEYQVQLEEKLCIKGIKKQLESAHFYLSPKQTEGKRLLALLPQHKKEAEKKKFPFTNKKPKEKITQAVASSTTLRDTLKNQDFGVIVTEENMTLDDFRTNLVIELSEHNGSPFYLFLYIITHSSHDEDCDDVFFTMGDIYLNQLLNEVNSCFASKEAYIFVLHEGCRKKTKNKGPNVDSPKNAIVLYSIMKGEYSLVASAEKKFATPSRFSEEFTKNIVPGISLRKVIIETWRHFYDMYAEKKENDNYEIKISPSPKQTSKERIPLAVQLSDTKCQKLLDFIF